MDEVCKLTKSLYKTFVNKKNNLPTHLLFSALDLGLIALTSDGLGCTVISYFLS